MTQPPWQIAIIGGGITGLATAYYLEQFLNAAKVPFQIWLFESKQRLGGKIFTMRRDDLTLELGAESFLTRKQFGVRLCHELGIDDQLQGTRPENKRTFVWSQEKMHPLLEGLSGFVPGSFRSLWTTSLLSPLGKARVAMDWILPARKNDADESVASFISRRLGRQAYRRLVQPLLCGIYGADGENLSLQATYPELRELEKKFGSLIRGLSKRKSENENHSSNPSAANGQTPPSSEPKSLPPFATLPGGMQDLVDTLNRKLQYTKVVSGVTVDSVTTVATANVQCEQNRARLANNRIGVRYRIEGTEIAAAGLAISNLPELLEFDQVICTAPAWGAANMLRSLSDKLADKLQEIKHVSTATVNLWYEQNSLEHPLGGYGFVIPTTEQRGMTAVTWTSSKHYSRSRQGKKLIRVYLGNAEEELDPLMPDDEIMRIVYRELRRTMGISALPEGYQVFRWDQGSPQYDMGHTQRLVEIDRILEDYKGVHCCGASYRGVGIPDCIRQAFETANKVFKQLTSDPNI